MRDSGKLTKPGDSLFSDESLPASIQEVDVQTPGRWPFWHTERYSRFTNSPAGIGLDGRGLGDRVGPTSWSRSIRLRNRRKSVTGGDVFYGERIGSNFFYDGGDR